MAAAPPALVQASASDQERAPAQVRGPATATAWAPVQVWAPGRARDWFAVSVPWSESVHLVAWARARAPVLAQYAARARGLVRAALGLAAALLAHAALEAGSAPCGAAVLASAALAWSVSWAAPEMDAPDSGAVAWQELGAGFGEE